MKPVFIKVAGLSGECEHFINLNEVERIELQKMPNCAAYKLYVVQHSENLNIAISAMDTGHLLKRMEDWT